MRKYLLTILTISSLILGTGYFENVNAQRGEGVFSGSFSLGLPQGPFEEQLDEIGFGLNLMGGYLLPGAPVMIGLDLNFSIFGIDRRTEPLSTTIPDLRVDVENSYNMLSTLFLVRTTGRSRTFRPYIDALVGFNYLYTDTVVRSRGTLENSPGILTSMTSHSVMVSELVCRCWFTATGARTCI